MQEWSTCVGYYCIWLWVICSYRSQGQYTTFTMYGRRAAETRGFVVRWWQTKPEPDEQNWFEVVPRDGTWVVRDRTATKSLSLSSAKSQVNPRDFPAELTKKTKSFCRQNLLIIRFNPRDFLGRHSYFWSAFCLWWSAFHSLWLQCCRSMSKEFILLFSIL